MDAARLTRVTPELKAEVRSKDQISAANTEDKNKAVSQVITEYRQSAESCHWTALDK